MEIVKDEKYWSDYTEFINEVEKLTDLSPTVLLSHYRELIDELNEADQKYFIEWKFEIIHNLLIRQEIQKVIEHKPIKKNLLQENFKSLIYTMDSEIKKHILNFEQSKWWENPEICFEHK